MLTKIKATLTYANVMATIAVFVALGGGAYAATQLPKNSVGPAQIKKNAVSAAKIKKNSVSSSKVKDGSLSAGDFKPGEVVGAAGPAGPKGDRGDSGAAGRDGAPGPAGPFPEGNLPRGKTLRGNYSVAYRAGAATEQAQDAVSFGFMLAAAPTPHYIKTGDAVPADCGATAEVAPAPGHLCVYEANAANRVSTCIVWNNALSCDQTNRFGFGLNVQSTAAGATQVGGTWAVTSG